MKDLIEEIQKKISTDLKEEDLDVFVGNALFRAGIRPSYSSGVCGSLTCGYGKLDYNGYWEFPVTMDEAYQDVKREEDD